jgi:hypothetical protein
MVTTLEVDVKGVLSSRCFHTVMLRREFQFDFIENWLHQHVRQRCVSDESTSRETTGRARCLDPRLKLFLRNSENSQLLWEINNERLQPWICHALNCHKFEIRDSAWILGMEVRGGEYLFVPTA